MNKQYYIPGDPLCGMTILRNALVIVKNNLQNKVKICIPVHDEYNIEAPEEIAEKVALVLQKCMEKGAKPFCTRLPLSTDIARLDDGNLPDYWIH